jgi:GTP-binding protein
MFSLIKTVYTPKDIHDEPGPQIALAGRSNVGKSTLINCLAERKNLAKTSSSPGKTRSINFYWVSPDNFYLVDLPGYGYARRSKQERQQWSRLVNAYLQASTGLKGVVVLLDSRISPQKLDLEMVSFLSTSGISLIPVLTKIDKCKMSWRHSIVSTWKDLLSSHPEPIPFSARTGINTRLLWSAIKECLNHDLPG